MAAPATGQPLTLKCGLTLQNRLVKAAMAENMGSPEGLPPPAIHSPYNVWSQGGWGMVLTGNVQVSSKYLGSPRDVSLNQSIPYEQQLDAWKSWAAASNCAKMPTIVQINHPGRQCSVGNGTRGFFEKNVAPSAVMPRLGAGLMAEALTRLLFGTPKAMSIEEIKEVIHQFAATARLAADAGFSGVEIHAAHGYLLTQFMSADSNKRTDDYGGSPAARVKIVLDIIQAIREVTPKNFAIGIKVNSVDQVSAELADCIEQLKLIVTAGIDFVEVSGGSMENLAMFANAEDQAEAPDAKVSNRTKAREAFFLDFAREIRQALPDVPLMVTGGFRTRRGIENAISRGDCSLAGLGRPAVLHPNLPKNLVLNPDVEDEDARFSVHRVESSPVLDWLGLQTVGTGAQSRWYSGEIRRLQ